MNFALSSFCFMFIAIVSLMHIHLKCRTIKHTHFHFQQLPVHLLFLLLLFASLTYARNQSTICHKELIYLHHVTNTIVFIIIINCIRVDRQDKMFEDGGSSSYLSYKKNVDRATIFVWKPLFVRIFAVNPIFRILYFCLIKNIYRVIPSNLTTIYFTENMVSDEL